MTDAALTIPFTADKAETTTTEQRFVHLKQIKQAESGKTVTMYDIKQMVSRARLGLSARTYKPDNCSGYIDGHSIVSQFDFYSWPSSVDLPHTIISSLGNVSAPRIIEKRVEFSVPFELSDTVELDFMLTNILSAKWETGCYDSDGKVVHDIGDPWMDGLTTMRVAKPVFGVVRIVAMKKGAQHRLNVRLVKIVPVQSTGDLPTEEEFEASAASEFYTYQEWLSKFYGYTDAVSWASHQGIETVPQEPVNLTGLSITNLQATVTAKWMEDGEEKTESLRMEIPQCLQDLLEACGVDTDGDGVPDFWGDLSQYVFRLCRGSDIPINVYVSSCTGKVLLAIRRDEDENSWCGNG